MGTWLGQADKECFYSFGEENSQKKAKLADREVDGSVH